MKTRALWLWPFFVLFFIFLWPLITLQKSFILYEYAIQHLPWAWHVFQGSRVGDSCWWTPLITCGFPLAAEGQAAPFYLLNILSYKLLPFIAAYTWSIPLHILIGGLGLYAYARSAKLSGPAACLAATAYAFGSGFAGCFYYTATLKTLAWFPLSLFVLEKMRAGGPRTKIIGVCVLSLFFSQAWTAGFPQIAVYFFLYCLLHEIFIFKLSQLVSFFISLVLGTLLALPQIAATLELAGQSVRSGESVSFALWGSVMPPALVSLVFPEWGNTLGFSFYIGIAPLFFALAAFAAKGKELYLKRHIFLSLVFLFLSLGKFNPAYRWVVEAFSLTSVRNPSKFLFFTVTSLCVLVAYGLDRFLSSGDAEKRSLALFYKKIAAFATVLPLAALALKAAARPLWGSYSSWYVSRLVAQKGESAKPAAEYIARMDHFFEKLSHLFSYLNVFNLTAIVFCVLCAALVGLMAKNRISTKKFLIFLFLLLISDLCIFGNFFGSGFTGNAGDLSRLAPRPAVERLLRNLDGKEGSVVEFVKEPSNELLVPDANMLYGVPHAGGYSPLLLKNYYELTHDLGIVDGSLGRKPFSKDVWRKERALLDVIGARWIHSDAPLGFRDLKIWDQAAAFYLYQNGSVLPKVSAFYDWKVLPEKKERLAFLKGEDFDPGHTIVLSEPVDLEPTEGVAGWVDAKILEDSGTQLRAEVDMGRDGVIFTRVAAYPGWKLILDSRPASWVIVNHAFIGFPVKKGAHQIALIFQPTGQNIYWKICAASWIVLLMTLILTVSRKIRSRK